jgi:hypothetical protein
MIVADTGPLAPLARPIWVPGLEIEPAVPLPRDCRALAGILSPRRHAPREDWLLSVLAQLARLRVHT